MKTHCIIFYLVFSLLSGTAKAYQKTNWELVIPKGYRGWIGIIYGCKDGKPLDFTRELVLVEFNAQGVACTSSKFSPHITTKTIIRESDGQEVPTYNGSLRWKEQGIVFLHGGATGRSNGGKGESYSMIGWIGPSSKVDPIWANGTFQAEGFAEFHRRLSGDNSLILAESTTKVPEIIGCFPRATSEEKIREAWHLFDTRSSQYGQEMGGPDPRKGIKRMENVLCQKPPRLGIAFFLEDTSIKKAVLKELQEKAGVKTLYSGTEAAKLYRDAKELALGSPMITDFGDP